MTSAIKKKKKKKKIKSNSGCRWQLEIEPALSLKNLKLMCFDALKTTQLPYRCGCPEGQKLTLHPRNIAFKDKSKTQGEKKFHKIV